MAGFEGGFLMMSNLPMAIRALLLTQVLLLGAPVAGADVAVPALVDPHAAHRLMVADSNVRRNLVNYQVPAVGLLRDDGAEVVLSDELKDDRPVVMNFIYTTCTTICPMGSQIFSLLQERLGQDRNKVHLVSISIDPEVDTPAKLRAYARRFHAGSEWQHYTGSLAASVQAQRAFNVFQGGKMNHSPVVLVRPKPGADWVRYDGFATADDLLAELKDSLGS
jgi:protein SCO1